MPKLKKLNPWLIYLNSEIEKRVDFSGAKTDLQRVTVRKLFLKSNYETLKKQFGEQNDLSKQNLS